MESLKLLTLAILAISLMWVGLVTGLNAMEDTSNQAVCDQAKRLDGEENTLFKCGNYYRTHDIKYLRGAFDGQ